jgi:hypothetical protein
VWATATARATPTNAAQCLRPWAVADKWTEGNGDPWTQSSVFDPSQGDTYDPNQGFSRMDANGDPVDLGYQLTLKLFNPGAGETYVMSSGWTMKLDLPNANTPQYPNNISGCTSITVPFADPNSNCTVEDPEAGCVGVLTGSSTGQDNMGITDLIAQDQGATWDRVNNRVNTTMGTSPRVVPVAVFDTGLYVSQGYNGTNGVVKVVNILGFFVEGFCNDLAPSQRESYLQCTTNGPERDIVGRLVSFSGTAVPTGPAAGPGAFGQLITLVR